MARDALLPVFAKGESITIQRAVNGQNVLMFVEAEDGCSLGMGRMTLTAHILRYGVSSYADGRVENQRRSIERLLNQRERVIALAREIGAEQILAVLLEPTPEAEAR